jgi:hypothetical protein
MMYDAATLFACTVSKEASMKSGAVISIIFLGVFGSALAGPALAQNALGGPTKKPNLVGGPGPTKQSAIGGPTQRASPVVTTPKSTKTVVTPPPPTSNELVKCAKGASCASGKLPPKGT